LSRLACDAPAGWSVLCNIAKAGSEASSLQVRRRRPGIIPDAE
jgi:hypothetical protein